MAEAIHGNKSQNARTKALKAFKEGQVRVLVATDIAARGLDIDQLPHVVNFELPNVPEDYVHRIGRTGRAGNEGEAVSLVCSEELSLLTNIEKLIKAPIDRVEVEGFSGPSVNDMKEKRKPRPDSPDRPEAKPKSEKPGRRRQSVRRKPTTTTDMSSYLSQIQAGVR
jgi:ATP-dependent RNA helicase RhlE